MRRLLLLTISVAATAGGEALPVAIPENLERLDPMVVELIEAKLSETGTRSDSAERHGDLALVYEANNLWPAARASLDNAVSLAPQDRWWRFHLALARRELGDFEGAVALLKTLSKEAPDSAPVAQRLGEALLESGQVAGAKQQFERLARLESDSPHGHVGLGDVLLRQGDARGAATALERAVAMAPGYRAARYLLGTAYLRLGRRGDAKRQLELGVGATWDYLPDPLTQRLRNYAMNLTARLDRAGALLSAGQPERAAAVLEEVRRAHPGNVTVANNLAIAYMRLDRLDEARALLESALEVNDEKFSTWLNLAFWALRSRKLEQALEYADAAVTRAPEIAQPYFTRAQVLANLGRFSDALASLADSLERDSGNPAAEAFSGDLCLRLRRFQNAKAHYRNAAELDARFLPAWAGLVRASLALGQSEAAKDALAKARKIAPGHPLVKRLEQELARGKLP